MQMYSNVIFVQKYACDKKIIHSTGCSLAGVTCDSSVSVQFKTICDMWCEHYTAIWIKHVFFVKFTQWWPIFVRLCQHEWNVVNTLKMDLDTVRTVDMAKTCNWVGFLWKFPAVWFVGTDKHSIKIFSWLECRAQCWMCLVQLIATCHLRGSSPQDIHVPSIMSKSL